MDALAAYGEDDSNDEGSLSPENISSENVSHSVKGVTVDIMKSKFNLNSAPAVIPKVDGDKKYLVAPGSKETQFNVKYDELFAPSFGPENPFKTSQQKAVKNMLSGLAEPAHFSDFQFDNQRKTFHSYGYALDPSTVSGDVQGDRFVGDVSKAEDGKGVTVFEGVKPRPGDRRKREKPGDPGDLDGYKGPWASFVDEEKVSKPSEEEQAILEEYDAVKQKRNKKEDEKIEEKTKLHIDDAYDYQGRSFLHIPQDLDVDLKSPDPPEKCFLPKKRIHTWSGHSKGVSCVRLFPVSGHLMLSASMDCKIKIWEVYNKRRNIRTYTGHSKAVRDVCFNNDGTKFLSCGYDRWIKLWDTETGECIGRFSNKKIAYCVKFNPDEDKQHLFIAGMADKKMITWDTRENEIVQEYDRHLGAVNTITFVDQNRRIVTTSDDKSIRIWEWDIPVDSKYIADPGMHSMPSCTLSPNGKWLACQSMDNQIKIYGVLNKFRENRKKVFKGHMNAGYACQVNFSPDMAYLISGDADGKLNIWDWKTTKLFCKFKAHDEVCIGCVWLPHETSKIITCGWDGLIKLWD